VPNKQARRGRSEVNIAANQLCFNFVPHFPLPLLDG